MGGAHSMQGREKKCIQFQSEHLKGRDNLEDPGVHGRIILQEVLGRTNCLLSLIRHGPHGPH
jgi:hypothetical protein